MLSGVPARTAEGTVRSQTVSCAQSQGVPLGNNSTLTRLVAPESSSCWGFVYMDVTINLIQTNLIHAIICIEFPKFMHNFVQYVTHP
jgi:hypothetical protein